MSFRQPVTTGGHVDAGWWPRSRDLTLEVPALLDVLWTAAREMTRVTYHLGSWEPAPRKMHIAGRLVHLGGYHKQDPLVLSVSDARNTDRVDFLIIAPDTPPEWAERAMHLASDTDQLATPADLFAAAER